MCSSKIIKLPIGFITQIDGSIVCPHRNCSCCSICVALHKELVEVRGLYYIWVNDPIERNELDSINHAAKQ